MAIRVLCYPPLGQTTVLTESQVCFTACIGCPNEAAEWTWELALWFSAGGEWSELPFMPTTSALNSSTNASSEQATNWNFYNCTLSGLPDSKQVFFTLKFRIEDEPWQWAKDSFGDLDGEVRYQARKAGLPESLRAYLPNLDSSLQITFLHKSYHDEVLVWEISDLVPGAKDPICGYSSRLLGVPADFSHWFSLVRHSTAWIGPRHGKGKIDLDADGMLCSFLRNDGYHLCLLAVTTADVVTIMKTSSSGDLFIEGKTDCSDSRQAIVVAAVGPTFELVNKTIMERASEIIAGTVPSQSESANYLIPQSTNIDAVYHQRWYDGLSFCTWNALGQDLDQDKILDSLRSLSEHEVFVQNLLIDDNWQSLDHVGADQSERGWIEFEANETGFPDGLRGLVSSIKRQHSHISHIGVWHGVFGYWGGVSPDGELAERYKTKVVRKERDYNDRNSITILIGEEVSQVYEAFYEFLRDSGITLVKADTRHLLDCLSDSDDRRNTILGYKDAWLTASAKYFDMKVISCMALIPQLLFSPELLSKAYITSPHNHQQQKILLRTSDDFFPSSSSSHLWHIFWNAHNAVFTQHLNIIPDWDMFQTDHAYAAFHAAARCVSGGLVCITDHPGKHNLGLIKQMVANTPAGNGVVLRPTVPARTVQLYSAYEEQRFCKIVALQRIALSSRGQDANLDVAIMGVFNMSYHTHAELLPLTDFGIFQKHNGRAFAVRSHVTGTILAPLSGDADGSGVFKLELDDKGYDILTLHPLLSLDEGREVAILGLIGHMSGAAAVLSVNIGKEQDGTVVETRLKALGVFGLFITGQELSVNIQHLDVNLCDRRLPDQFQLMEEVRNGMLVKMDLEGAWKDLDLAAKRIVVNVRV